MEDKHPKNLEDVYEIILMRNADNFKMSRKTFIIKGDSFVMSKEDRKTSVKKRNNFNFNFHDICIYCLFEKQKTQFQSVSNRKKAIDIIKTNTKLLHNKSISTRLNYQI